MKIIPSENIPVLSTSGKKPPHLFWGWWINIVTSIISGFTGLVYPAASIVFKPIASELNLDRAAASGAAATGTVVGGILFATTGWLTDKFGPKWVVTAGAIIFSIGLILMSFIASAIHYYTIWGVLVIGGNVVAFTIALDVLMTRWFVRKRGVAVSLRFGVSSLMGVALLPLLGWASQIISWRAIYFWWGCITLIIIPLLFYFVKRSRPEDSGLLPDGDRAPNSGAANGSIAPSSTLSPSDDPEVEFTLKQTMRTSAFWMLTLAWILSRIAMAGFNLHFVPFLSDRGFSQVLAGSMLALMSLFTLPFSLLSGAWGDRVKRREHLRYLQAGTMVCYAGGYATIMFTSNLSTTYLPLLLLGVGSGAQIPLDILIRSRFFGRRAFGSSTGMSMLISMPFTFLAPIFTGWIYDMTGQYTTAFTLFTLLSTLAAIALFLTKVPKRPGANSIPT